ncbi:MAG TPA: amidohydrolase family protein, partial [Thermosynergistes sp.]|nr:amidohydrolase family protein [Thermosynergistes sp.]
VYIDCVSFNPLAVDFARKVVGADHMMAGSDYPHQIGSLTKCTAVIEALDVPAPEKEKILGGNAKALFKM